MSEYWKNLRARGPCETNPLTPDQVRERIIKAKFKLLQDNLKL